MPDTISLKAYIAKLEALLDGNATDEVIHHCRQILQFYPKHADTYRILGRALLYSERWEEARAIFQRVLSVYPDDYVAHIGLSEIYDVQGRANEAIWHLERAYEQEPHNGELISSLRTLYQKHHKSDQTRIQLTTAALARQYRRSGLYAEALDLLRSTLEQMPTRIDLQVLLVDTLWQDQQRIEAAEQALDVLRVLPYCLIPNRVLTELWLAEERPSDAQRFLNHLEAVDPYLAMELAQGGPVDEMTYSLELLDYRRVAQKELAASRPAWLSEIDSAAPEAEADSPPKVAAFEGDWDTGSDTAPDRADSGDREGVPEATDETLPEVTLTLTDRLRLGLLREELTPAREARPETDLVFDDKVEGFEPTEHIAESHARDLRRETSQHASIFTTKPTAEDEVPDWLISPTGDEEEDLLPPELVADDPLAWLRGNVEVDDSAVERGPGTALDANRLLEDAGDPFAWARQSGLELEPQGAVEDDADADPLAWMHRSGIEWSEDEDKKEEAAPSVDPFETEEEALIIDPAANPLAWMQAYDVEVEPDIVEALRPQNIVEEVADDSDPFAWLRNAGVEFDEDSLKESRPPVFDMSEDDVDLEGDTFDWLQDEHLLDGVLEDVDPSVLETRVVPRVAADEAQSGGTGLVRWLEQALPSPSADALSDDASTMTFDWLENLPTDPPAQRPPDDSGEWSQ